MINIKENYLKKVIPLFLKSGYKNLPLGQNLVSRRLEYKNKFAIPRIDKVVINVGLGSFLKGDSAQKDLLENIKKDLSLITGQAAVQTKARTSIAGFGTRKGQTLGLKVTLRGKRMTDFLSRFINVTLPRTKDFTGINSDAFDGYGNLTVGVKDHTAFPEINIEHAAQHIKRTLGLEITIVTSAKDKKEGFVFLKTLGFPLQEEGKE